LRRGAVVAAALLVAGCAMSSPAARGIVDGRLAPCPDSPNCVCSDHEGNAFVAPLGFAGDAADAWRAARAAIEATGGVVVSADASYLHATYTTRVLRFVDDVELRLDASARIIHVRSVSRVGYYDFGLNEKRAKAIADAFSRLVPTASG